MKPFIVSYVPLLYTTPAAVDATNRKERERFVRELGRVLTDAQEKQIGAAHGCGWLDDPEDKCATPFFIMDYGREIAKHMLWWSEGRPEKFFQFQIRRVEPGRYQTWVVPNFKQSASRMDFAVAELDLIKSGPVSMQEGASYIFVPLYADMSQAGTAEQLHEKGRLPQPGQMVRFGILDAGLNRGSEDELEFDEDFDWIGEIPVTKPLSWNETQEVRK